MDLGNILKSVLGGSGEGSSSEGSGKLDLMSIITGLIGGQGGAGLGELVKKFTENGLGDVVSSWIGKGDNAPVSPEQVKDVFGEDGIQEMANKTGMNKEELTGQLSDILPKAIDKVTPDGKLPDTTEESIDLGKIGDLLGGLFGKKE